MLLITALLCISGCENSDNGVENINGKDFEAAENGGKDVVVETSILSPEIESNSYWPEIEGSIMVDFHGKKKYFSGVEKNTDHVNFKMLVRNEGKYQFFLKSENEEGNLRFGILTVSYGPFFGGQWHVTLDRQGESGGYIQCGMDVALMGNELKPLWCNGLKVDVSEDRQRMDFVFNNVPIAQSLGQTGVGYINGKFSVHFDTSIAVLLPSDIPSLCTSEVSVGGNQRRASFIERTEDGLSLMLAATNAIPERISLAEGKITYVAGKESAQQADKTFKCGRLITAEELACLEKPNAHYKCPKIVFSCESLSLNKGDTVHASFSEELVYEPYYSKLAEAINVAATISCSTGSVDIKSNLKALELLGQSPDSPVVRLVESDNEGGGKIWDTVIVGPLMVRRNLLDESQIEVIANSEYEFNVYNSVDQNSSLLDDKQFVEFSTDNSRVTLKGVPLVNSKTGDQRTASGHINISRPN